MVNNVSDDSAGLAGKGLEFRGLLSRHRHRCSFWSSAKIPTCSQSNGDMIFDSRPVLHKHCRSTSDNAKSMIGLPKLPFMSPLWGSGESIHDGEPVSCVLRTSYGAVLYTLGAP